MSFYLMQCHPEPLALAAWAARQEYVSPDGDYGYALHALLTAAFGAGAPKSFRYFGKQRGLLAYCTLDADTMHSHAALAAPDVVRALGLDTLGARIFPTQWKPGQRLAFEVRVRPTVRHGSKERDAFLRLIELNERGEGSRMPREEVYRRWLVEQLEQEQAVKVSNVSLTGFQLTRLLRRNQATEDGVRKLAIVSGPDATFTGELAVSDPTAFARLLVRGAGRHRAFGFGMLLLKPADRC